MRPYGHGAAVTEGGAHRARYGNLRKISDLLIYRRKSKAVGREPDGFHYFMLLWNYFWISSTHCW